MVTGEVLHDIERLAAGVPSIVFDRAKTLGDLDGG